MAKIRTKYVCQQCGGEQSKWVGKCPDCGAWNSMEETVELPQSPAQQRRQALSGTSAIAQGTQIPLVLQILNHWCSNVSPSAMQRWIACWGAAWCQAR